MVLPLDEIIDDHLVDHSKDLYEYRDYEVDNIGVPVVFCIYSLVIKCVNESGDVDHNEEHHNWDLYHYY